MKLLASVLLIVAFSSLAGAGSKEHQMATRTDFLGDAAIEQWLSQLSNSGGMGDQRYYNQFAGEDIRDPVIRQRVYGAMQKDGTLQTLLDSITNRDGAARINASTARFGDNFSQLDSRDSGAADLLGALGPIASFAIPGVLNGFGDAAGAAGGAVGGSGAYTLADAGNIMTDVGPGYGGGATDSLANYSAAAEAADAAGGSAMLNNAGLKYSDILAPAAGAAAGGAAGGITGSQVAGGAGAAAATAAGAGGGGAMDQDGSKGVFDSSGNPLYKGVDAAASASAISRILNGTATAEDWLKVAGAAAPGVLGAISSSSTASKLSDLADKYSNYGAPSRDRYEASFAPGFTMANDPGYQDALDQAGKTTLHALSVNGNPADSPNAWAASQKDLYDKTAYPALQAYRNTNSVGGGLASGASAAPNLATAAINQTGTTMADLGGAARDVFSPTTSTFDDLLKKLKGNNNIFAVN